MGALVYAVLLAAYVVFGAPTHRLGDETVVVLPGENGKIGGVVVRRGFQKEVVLDTAYAASHIGVDGKLKPEQLSPATVQQEYGKTIAALPLKPATFVLYFVTGSDELTQESKSELDQVFAEIRKRPIPDVLLIGHTDTVGDIESNDILSRQRADKVRDILVQAGIKTDRIEVAGRGERELLVPTGDNVEEPRNRGVEINVR
jgi:outer membrane protein OmpA-like peptidoglycan-associated protein